MTMPLGTEPQETIYGLHHLSEGKSYIAFSGSEVVWVGTILVQDRQGDWLLIMQQDASRVFVSKSDGTAGTRYRSVETLDDTILIMETPEQQWKQAVDLLLRHFQMNLAQFGAIGSLEKVYQFTRCPSQSDLWHYVTGSAANYRAYGKADTFVLPVVQGGIVHNVMCHAHLLCTATHPLRKN